MKGGVAVVIPCHNQARWIRRTVSSVLAQRPSPAQVIVVDDGSTDSSADIVREFEDRITLVQQLRAGACAARNQGLRLVESQFVCFLDGDDYIEGNFCGGAEKSLDDAGADVAFCPVITERPDASRVATFHYSAIPEPKRVFEGWLNHYSQPPCSIVWRSDFVRSIGGWDERVQKNQDGELVMRAMLATPRIAKFESGQGIYNAHEDPSISKVATRQTLQSEFDAMLKLIQLAKARSPNYDVSGFGKKLYIIARGAFVLREHQLGREALDAARRVGLRGHVGSPSHRLFASITGLELKTTIASLLRSI